MVHYISLRLVCLLANQEKVSSAYDDLTFAMHDLPTEPAHHRKDKPKEIGPLWTHEPLDPARQKKKPPQPPRRRKRNQPDTPAFTFNPALKQVPVGVQPDPPASPSTPSEPSVPESFTRPYDEQQMTPHVDRETHGSFYDDSDAQKRPRVFSDGPPIEHTTTSFYPDTSCTDSSEGVSVPPAGLSDQPPCAVEFVYGRYPPATYPYSSQGYGQPAMFTQDAYGYPAMDHYADRSAQSYPAPHFDATHGRAAPHGVPTYPDGNVYPYPPRKY